MPNDIYGYELTTLSPWAWHGLAVPSGTATLNDIVTDTAMAFAVANAIGMASRSPCLPSEADYRAHLAALPFRTSLFMGYSNRLNRPLARRLNLDTEGGMPQSIDLARKSGNIKDYYHIQEVAIGSVFRGHFLHADPFRVAEEAYGVHVDQMVVRLGLGRTGMGVLRRCTVDNNIYLNLHTALLFDPGINLEGGSYRLHTIQPSRALSFEEALRLTAGWA